MYSVKMHSFFVLWCLFFVSFCTEELLDDGAKKERAAVDKMRSWQLTGFGRKLESMDRQHFPGAFINVMSYNVLAQNLLNEHPHLYNEHNRKALVWEFRWTNILHEINRVNPEIMCLQEVQGSHIKDYYSNLSALGKKCELMQGVKGYEGIYKQRTGLRSDGCAIYYRRDKFNLIKHTTVEFFQPNVTILNRDNVAIIAKFAPIDNRSAEFIVATTHLLYNPRRQDVRVAQTQLLLSELERIAFKRIREDNTNEYLPIILTGDFNATPDSSVVELILEGELDYQNLSPKTLEKTNSPHKMGKVLIPPTLRINDHCQHAELVRKRNLGDEITPEEELEIIKVFHSERKFVPLEDPTNISTMGFSTGTLQHNFVFKTANRYHAGNDTEATTFQDEWIMVDYIFYTGKIGKKSKNVEEDKLKLVAVYTLPTTKQLGTMKIPNFALGSDHLSLVAKFKLLYDDK